MVTSKEAHIFVEKVDEFCPFILKHVVGKFIFSSDDVMCQYCLDRTSTSSIPGLAWDRKEKGYFVSFQNSTTVAHHFLWLSAGMGSTSYCFIGDLSEKVPVVRLCRLSLLSPSSSAVNCANSMSISTFFVMRPLLDGLSEPLFDFIAAELWPVPSKVRLEREVALREMCLISVGRTGRQVARKPKVSSGSTHLTILPKA